MFKPLSETVETLKREKKKKEKKKKNKKKKKIAVLQRSLRITAEVTQKW